MCFLWILPQFFSSLQGSGHVGSINLKDLRNQVQTDHTSAKQKEFEAGPKASYGYGGQFGVQKDRMDKVSIQNLPFYTQHNFLRYDKNVEHRFVISTTT